MKQADYLAAFAVILLWGFNFITIKIAVGIVPPLMVTAIRFLLSALVLIFWVPVPRGHMKSIFVLSVIMGAGHFAMLFYGLTGVDVAVAAIIVQLGVPFSAVLAHFFLKDKMGWLQAFGMLVSFTGVAILVGEPQTISNPVATMLVLVAAFAWGLGNVQAKKIGNVNPLSLIAYMYLFATPILVAATLMFETGQVQALRSTGTVFWLSMAYITLGSSVIAYGLWYRLVDKFDVSEIAPFNLCTPIIAVIGGMIVFGDQLTWYKVVGGCLTIAGVAVIQLRWKRSAQA